MLVMKAAKKIPLFIDQGDADEFLDEQLKPDLLKEACASNDYPLNLRIQPGYDHSYYFISTFIGEHLHYHAEALRN
jgi:S-formylglutathione hydrolase